MPRDSPSSSSPLRALLHRRARRTSKPPPTEPSPDPSTSTTLPIRGNRPTPPALGNFVAISGPSPPSLGSAPSSSRHAAGRVQDNEFTGVASAVGDVESGEESLMPHMLASDERFASFASSMSPAQTGSSEGGSERGVQAQVLVGAGGSTEHVTAQETSASTPGAESSIKSMNRQGVAYKKMSSNAPSGIVSRGERGVEPQDSKAPPRVDDETRAPPPPALPHHDPKTSLSPDISPTVPSDVSEIPPAPDTQQPPAPLDLDIVSALGSSSSNTFTTTDTVTTLRHERHPLPTSIDDDELTKTLLAPSTTEDLSIHRAFAPAKTIHHIRPHTHTIHHQHITTHIHTHDIHVRYLPLLDIETLPAKHFLKDPDTGALTEVQERDVAAFVSGGGRAGSRSAYTTSYSSSATTTTTKMTSVAPRPAERGGEEEGEGKGEDAVRSAMRQMRAFSAREIREEERKVRWWVGEDGVERSERWVFHRPVLVGAEVEGMGEGGVWFESVDEEGREGFWKTGEEGVERKEGGVGTGIDVDGND